MFQLWTRQFRIYDTSFHMRPVTGTCRDLSLLVCFISRSMLVNYQGRIHIGGSIFISCTMALRQLKEFHLQKQNTSEQATYHERQH